MMKYNLSAVEILKMLGYDQPVGREMLEAFKKENHISLPKCYEEFMELAYECPLLETADIWADNHDYFYYEFLQEEIEDFSEDWEEAPEEYEDDELYQLSKLPKEEWGRKVDNFLLIGSDYGAGIVKFGIKDLDMENPPVYMQHEANPRTQWSKEYETVTDYLAEVVLNTLSLTDYETAEEAVEEMDWEYNDCDLYDDKEMSELLEEAGIDLDQIHLFGRAFNETKTFCCYDEEEEVLYAGRIGENRKDSVLYRISR